MDKSLFYNNMHVAVEDLEQIYVDVETLMVNHIYDYHNSVNQFVLANQKYGMNSMKVLAQAYPSLTIEVSGGVAYQDQKRVEITSTENYIIKNPPAILGGGLNITRIDLIYLLIEQVNSYPYSTDFINANRNIYQETVYTRSLTSYSINQVTGTYNIGGATKPAIPSGGIALAYIHMRDGTNKIYNDDTGSLNEGFIEDARTLVTP